MEQLEHVRTPRLVLDRPTTGDLAALHELYADPRVWQHAPHARHRDPATTASMLQRWLVEWRDTGLGMWLVRRPDEAELLGNAGCALRGAGTWWNLGYRFSPTAQGQGYAAEAAATAAASAPRVVLWAPVVASILEHNAASPRVAGRLGLALEHCCPDPATHASGGVRLLFADRPLSPQVITSVLAPGRGVDGR